MVTASEDGSTGGATPRSDLSGARGGDPEGAAAFVAGWGAITISALVVGLAVGLSSAFAYETSVTVSIMVVGHALLGLIEGAITATVYGYVARTRPDLVLSRFEDDALSPEVSL